MGSSASHTSRDKDDLLLAAEEGRPRNKRETAKEKASRERRGATARKRRERALEKHRRKAEKCFRNDNLGVCRTPHMNYWPWSGFDQAHGFLAVRKKDSRENATKQGKAEKATRWSGEVEWPASWTMPNYQLARVKVIIKVIKWVTHENGQRVRREENAEVELCPSDRFWLSFMWCYSKFLEGIVPIPVSLPVVDFLTSSSPLRELFRRKRKRLIKTGHSM